jgi:hypothetical protein
VIAEEAALHGQLLGNTGVRPGKVAGCGRAGTDDQELTGRVPLQRRGDHLIARTVMAGLARKAELVEQFVVHAAAAVLAAVGLRCPNWDIEAEHLAEHPGDGQLVAVTGDDGDGSDADAGAGEVADGEEVVGVVAEVGLDDQVGHGASSTTGRAGGEDGSLPSCGFRMVTTGEEDPTQSLPRVGALVS